MLESDHTRLFFWYKTLDDKYGMLFDDEETGLRCFEDGEDQRSYERLLNLIEQSKT